VTFLTTNLTAFSANDSSKDNTADNYSNVQGKKETVSGAVYNPQTDLEQVKQEKEKENEKRIIVKYKDAKKSESVKNSVKQKLKLTKLELKKELKSEKIQVYEVDNTDNIDSVINEFKKKSDVDYVQEDYMLELFDVPSDPLFTEQWGLYNNGQVINGQAGTSGVDINILKAWEMTKGSEEVVVGLIDTGVDIYNSELAENIYINTEEIPGNGIDDSGNGFIDDVSGWNFVNDNGTVFDGSEEDRHGTGVAGVIAGVENGYGICG